MSTRRIPAASRAVGSGDGGLKRELRSRHIQMIALGGAIGTGLFYGSSDAIGVAGPSVLLAYLVVGAVIFLIIRALGEMSVDEPVSGAFSHYAHRNWSPRAGFVSGWNYWFNYIAVAMVELSVVGSFVNYWLPAVPTWVSAAIVLVLITGVNLIGVRAFGEFEFWFAIIKVAAVIAMIVLGVVVVVLGINSSPDLPTPSFAHLVDDGGFFPLGVGGTIASLAIVAFSFGGAELVAVTAGEAADPERTIPKAVNQVVLRILIFYIGALAVIMSVVPWSLLDGETSPFVQIFDRVGIPGAAHILNLVVLTAVVSVYNSGLYSNGRMLYSLAQRGSAPAYLGRLSRRGAPVAGVLTSSAVTVIAVVVVFLWPEFAFQYLLSIALIAAIINWGMIVITQMRFRRRIGPDAAAALAFPLPFARVAPWIVLAFLAGVVVLMAFSPQYRTAVVIGPVWIGVLLAAYEIRARRAKRADAA
ncbi:aromatic amino acid transporter AroP [Microbacterium barkeri]|uniref:Aromatic amino acid transporter AroP n=1 Tax=Microbacterium barkeri TaxID=33917 RepID=A0A9W6LWH2_9MICO|nr:amino acid permease [Microbacterium barkeri]MDR6878239.1 AAT family amino acid transporter [Microbacterium barkeri]GLJ61376.1 aromatic amino acid transporter AroP [Microbacterium barkeri]